MPSLSSDEARGRFAAAPVARLATVRPDGAPHLVPVVFAVNATASGLDRILMVVDPKPKQSSDLQRLRNIASNPAVSLLVDHYGADWGTLWWARADGIARIVTVGAAYDAVIAALRARYPQYERLRGPFGAAVIVEVARWIGWTARA